MKRVLQKTITSAMALLAIATADVGAVSVKLDYDQGYGSFELRSNGQDEYQLVTSDDGTSYYNIEPNSTLYFHFTGYVGYEVNEITATDADGGKLEITEEETADAGLFSKIQLGESDVTISVSAALKQYPIELKLEHGSVEVMKAVEMDVTGAPMSWESTETVDVTGTYKAVFTPEAGYEFDEKSLRLENVNYYNIEGGVVLLFHAITDSTTRVVIAETFKPKTYYVSMEVTGLQDVSEGWATVTDYLTGDEQASYYSLSSNDEVSQDGTGVYKFEPSEPNYGVAYTANAEINFYVSTSGYTVASVEVLDSAGNVVLSDYTRMEGNGNQVSFAMPASDVTVRVTYELHKYVLKLSSNALDDDCTVKVYESVQEIGSTADEKEWTGPYTTGDKVSYGSTIKLVAETGANYKDISEKDIVFVYYINPDVEPTGEMNNCEIQLYDDFYDTLYVEATFTAKEFSLMRAVSEGNSDGGEYVMAYYIDDNKEEQEVWVSAVGEDESTIPYGKDVSVSINKDGDYSFYYEVDNVSFKTSGGTELSYTKSNDEDDQEFYVFRMPADSVTLSYEFKPKKWTLAVSEDAAGGTVEFYKSIGEDNELKLELITDGTYEWGDMVVMKPVPAEGYVVSDSDIVYNWGDGSEGSLSWLQSDEDSTSYLCPFDAELNGDILVTQLGFVAKSYDVKVESEFFENGENGNYNVYAAGRNDTYTVEDSVYLSVYISENAYTSSQLGNVNMTVSKTTGDEDFSDYEVVEDARSGQGGWQTVIKFKMPAGDVSIVLDVVDREFVIAKVENNAQLEIAEKAQYGDSVTGKVIVDENYVLESLVYSTSSYTVGADVNTETELKADEEGNFSFSMPADNITVTATAVGKLLSLTAVSNENSEMSFLWTTINGKYDRDKSQQVNYGDTVVALFDLGTNSYIEDAVTEVSLTDSDGQSVPYVSGEWQYGTTGMNYSVTFVMTSDLTIGVTYKKLAHVVLNGSEGVSLSTSGTDKADSLVVFAGDTVKVYPTLEEGYVLTKATLALADQEIALEAEEDGAYTFVATQGVNDVTVIAQKETYVLQIREPLPVAALTIGDDRSTQAEEGKTIIELDVLKPSAGEIVFSTENAVAWGDKVTIVSSLSEQEYSEALEQRNRVYIYDVLRPQDGAEQIGLEMTDWVPGEEMVSYLGDNADASRYYMTATFVMPKEPVTITSVGKHIGIIVAEEDSTQASYVGNSWAAVAQTVNDTTSDVSKLNTINIANSFEYAASNLDLDTATLAGLAMNDEVQKVVSILRDSLTVNGNGNKVTNLTYVGSNLMEVIGEDGAFKKISFEEATLFTTVDGTNYLVTEDTIFVSVLAKTNYGTVSGFGYSGRVVVDYSQIPDSILFGREVVKCLVGENMTSGNVSGFLFDTEYQDPDSVGNRQCISIKQNLGIGRNMGNAKVATNGSTANKALTSSIDFSSSRFQQQEVVFSNEEFKNGIVAAWLNYSGKGFSGEFTGEWSQGPKYPVQAAVLDGVSNAMYRIDYATNDSASIIDAPDFQCGGRTVTVATTRKPQEVNVTNAEVVSSTDTETVIRLSGTGEPTVSFSFLKSLEDALVVVEKAEVSVDVNGRNITVSNGDAEVYNLAGLLVGRVGNGETISVATSGLYLVKVGNKAFRVIVKD